MKKKFILIDDDPIFIFLNKKVLETTTCMDSVQDFTSGIDALEHIKNNLQNIDKVVILLDIRMPIMDGFAFIDELKKAVGADISKFIIYLLSSSIYQADIDKAKEYQEVRDFLNKPLNTDKMESVCKELMSL
jgi:CheY-like chemotaxis protein